MATSGRTSSNDNTIAPSNLRRQNTLSKAARILRSASRRVVNNPLEHSTQSEPHHEPEPELQPDHQPLSDQLNQNQCFQLRGKTLNLFGPDHPVRRFLFVLFRSGWIDPLIFLLIIINLSILTFQSLPSVYDHPRRENSYFQGWDDYLLLAIFVIFTIESVSRIIVSGFIFNPTTSSSPQDDYPREVETKTNWLPKSFGKNPRITQLVLNNYHQNQPSSSNPTNHNFNVETPIPWTSTTPSNRPSPKTPNSSVPLLPNTPSISSSSRKISNYPSPQLTSTNTNNFHYHHQDSSNVASNKTNESLLYSYYPPSVPFQSGLQKQKRSLINQTAYLRQSWNRLDLIAIISFWIDFALFFIKTRDGTILREKYQIYVFKSLSCLRVMRLLTVTSGTTTILNSLKIASPLLVNVLYFIFFSVALFSIVGVQSFKGSYDRHCVWLDPSTLTSQDSNNNLINLSNYTFTEQTCGGQYNSKTGLAEGFIQSSTGKSFKNFKGYLCPQGQMCLETGNPNNGTQNFDNMAGAVLQVAIIASANSWSNMMYSLMDSEYFASCFFFIVCVLIMNFWLLNILVAVITNTFGEIASETKSSAFSNERLVEGSNDEYLDSSQPGDNKYLFTSSSSNFRVLNKDSEQGRGSSALVNQRTDEEVGGGVLMKRKNGREGYRFGWQEGLDKVNQRYLRYFWLLVVLVDFGFQASRNSSNVPWKDKLDHIQLGFTFAFAFEILLRLSIYIPDRLKNFIVIEQKTSGRSPSQPINHPTNRNDNDNRNQGLGLTSEKSKRKLREEGNGSERKDYKYQNLNIIDSLICVICLIIQLPVIKVKNPKLFVWLCFFQIARFYRIIVFFPRIGKLIRKLRGSFIGLMNMILFLLSMNFFAALIGSQLLRGVIPKADGVEMTFYSLWNSFLAMYQVFSSENWTTVLYSAMSAQAANKQEFISGILITCWFLFANFVLLQMFIAVISEGFEVAEEQKRKEQVRMLVDRVSLNNSSTRLKLFSRLNPYHLLDLRRSKKILKALGGFQSIPSSSSNNLPNTYNHHYQSNYNMVDLNNINGGYDHFKLNKTGTTTTLDGDGLPSQEIFGGQKPRVKEFLKLDQSNKEVFDPNNQDQITLRESYQRSFITRARKAFLLDPINDSFGDSKLSDKKFTNEEKLKSEEANQAVFLEMTPSERQQYYLDEYNEQLTRESEFIKAHPRYDKVFWIISQQNPIRKLCQILVEPAYGERLYGRKPNKIGVQIFKLIVFHAILGGVIVAAIATPVYIQNYYLTHGLSLSAWFTTTEMTLGFIFVLEFVIKVLADGFIFTPNAYLLNTWNRIDFFVLITLMIDITTSLVRSGTTNRALRSLKAFRALRLINLTKSIRETFFNVLILGFGDLLDASVLTVMYIVPFAVWGQTLFEDLLLSCNDSGDGIVTKWDCMGEYVGGPRGLDGIPDKFKFMMPRTWSNPEYSFDLFKSSLLILFEIISLEGWIDVMSSLMAITGKGLQPKQDASQGNAIFSLVYNLFGATVILSLFLSVIINNFLKRSGSAFLTTEQQQWINLRKLIMRQSPSKRPRSRPKDWIRNWCYTRAIHKYGFWSKMMTGLYTFHVALLLTLARSNMNSEFNFYRDFIFLGLSMVYLIDIMIKLLGLGFRSFYQNGWNIFDVITVLGTISTTVSIVKNHQDLSSNINQNILNSSNNSNSNVMIQFQKVFLVGIGFKLVLKINRLNRLFKVAISSLISIANLFGLWAIFFLVFGIMFVENFSLTRIGPSSISRNSNYQSLANSLVMLAIQSTGEGWNNFMHDYTVEAPYCIDSPNYLFNDCGSEVASYILFISWNVLSMYIILNMFTGLVVDNFAFVFQSVGKVRSIDRDEIRKFKVAWSEVDLEKTGYLREDQLCKFFSKLRGAFEVNVYPEELKVREMIRSCFKSAAEASYSFREGDVDETGKDNDDEDYEKRIRRKNGNGSIRKSMMTMMIKRKSRKSWTGGYLREDERPGSYEVLDIVELNRRLKSVDWNEIQKRKRLYEELYQEAKMIVRRSVMKSGNTRRTSTFNSIIAGLNNLNEEGKRLIGGISFNEMMLLVAHYKLINDDQAMRLEEYLDRKEQKQKVEDSIKFEKIEGVFKVFIDRNRFLRHLKTQKTVVY